MPAEPVLGYPSVEGVLGEHFFALHEREGGTGDDKMLKGRALAHGAVALVGYDFCRRFNLDNDPTAVAASNVTHDIFYS